MDRNSEVKEVWCTFCGEFHPEHQHTRDPDTQAPVEQEPGCFDYGGLAYTPSETTWYPDQGHKDNPKAYTPAPVTADKIRWCKNCAALAPDHASWCDRKTVKLDGVNFDVTEVFKDVAGNVTEVRQSGARKDDKGKAPVFKGALQYFPNALEAVARVSEYGFNKYGAWGGWRKVPDAYDRYTEALNRHNLDAGHQDHDPESKLLHIAHRAWNALATLELALTIGVDGAEKITDTK